MIHSTAHKLPFDSVGDNLIVFAVGRLIRNFKLHASSSDSQYVTHSFNVLRLLLKEGDFSSLTLGIVHIVDENYKKKYLWIVASRGRGRIDKAL